MTTLDYIAAEIVPAAFELLPARMQSTKARAMVLAIGLIESRFMYREQTHGGPARGFWQFEKGGGVRGVLNFPTTRPVLLPILEMLRYSPDPAECHEAIAHNDVLACVFARLLLWSSPLSLPGRDEVGAAWTLYLDTWRPGKPQGGAWLGFYQQAWDRYDE